MTLLGYLILTYSEKPESVISGIPTLLLSIILVGCGLGGIIAIKDK